MSLKTYAEQEGKQPFAWRAALYRALSAGDELPNEMATDLHFRAGKWVLCPCGNLPASIPRQSDGTPEDEIIRGLGGIFPTLVRVREWYAALTALELIESRAAVLLQEMADAQVQRRLERAGEPVPIESSGPTCAGCGYALSICHCPPDPHAAELAEISTEVASL